MAGFIYKPDTDKGPVFLAPTNQGPPVITSGDRRYVGRPGNEAGGVFQGREGFQWVFPREVINLRNASLTYGSSRGQIGQGNLSYRGSDLGGWQASNKGAIPGSFVSGGGGGGGVPRLDEFGNKLSDAGNPSANQAIDLSFVDYGSLVAPFVDFGAAFEFGQDVGRENVDTYFRNLTSDRTRNAALDFVRTDLEGIQMGLDTLVPRVRQEGRQDLEENISRANRLDQFNFQRIPGFNQFNRGQVATMNQFNRAEREKSIQAAGVDYRSRINNVLEQLETQSTGRLSDPLLDTLMTTTNRDRGADIAAASGVSPFSGAGINIQDKLDVNQRIGLALDAQKAIPGIATQAQGVLQPPEELLRTGLASPTQVPLNVSNIQDRIPVTSNISAGAAQQQVGTQATQIETIPAVTALDARLQTDRFNETGRFNRDLTVLDRTQGQLTAQDSENLRASLQDKEDFRQQQSLDAYYAGLDAQTTAAQQSSLANLAGSVLTSPTALGVAGGLLGGAFDAALQGYDAVFGDGDGRVTVGGTEISSGAIRDAVGSVINGGSGESTEAATGGGERSGGFTVDTPDSSVPTVELPVTASAGGRSYDVSSTGGSESTSETFRRLYEPVRPQVADARYIAQGANLVDNWNNLTPVQQAQTAGTIAVGVAANRGFIPQEQVRQVETANGALSTVLNPGATPGQRAAAIGQLGNLATSTSYGGNLNNPSTIGGVNVTGPTVMPDGSPGFILEDGSTVPRSELVQGANASAALSAFSVVTSDAPTDTKIAALTSIGMESAAANQIVSQVAAGNSAAALAIFATGKDFSQMNPVEKAANLTTTANLTYNALSQSAGAVPVNTGASFFGAALPGGATLGGIAAGAYTGYNQLTGAQKFLTGEGDKTSPIEQASLFTMTGGLSVFPSIERAVGGGGGKSTGRRMRDQWRAGLRENGLVDRNYNVTLADGSKYDIGRDDDIKLTNKEGKERFTFDIDWGDKVAVNAIPDAHLFAIATGLDPTDSSKAETFNRVVAQGVNAATSNANSYADAQANFKAMLKNTNPAELGARIEVLRQTDKISDQEYGVYLDRINKMYGTEFQPQDKGKARNSLIAQLRSAGPKMSKESKNLLQLLIDPRKAQKNRRRLDERLTAV